MRPATNKLVKYLVDKYGLDNLFKEPRIDVGGAETSRQFIGFFGYEVWDLREKEDTDAFIDVRYMHLGQRILTRHGGATIKQVGTVLTFDTLEHVFEAQDAADSIGRIIFPGGHVIVGVPFMWPFHDPSGDYWRFSPQALEKLFEKDFELVESGFYDWDVTDWQGRQVQTLASYYVGCRRAATREPKYLEL